MEASALKTAIEHLELEFRILHEACLSSNPTQSTTLYQVASQGCLEYLEDTICINCLVNQLVDCFLESYLETIKELLSEEIRSFLDSMEADIPGNIILLKCVNDRFCKKYNLY